MIDVGAQAAHCRMPNPRAIRRRGFVSNIQTTIAAPRHRSTGTFYNENHPWVDASVFIPPLPGAPQVAFIHRRVCGNW